MLVAVDSHLQRLQFQVNGIDSKLDELLVNGYRTSDHTTQIKTLAASIGELEDASKKGVGIGTKIAMLWAGAVTGVGGLLGLLHLMRVL